MSAAVASAPGKVILFGEHGVNRGQTAVAGAVDRRVLCRVSTRPDEVVTFSFDDRRQSVTWSDVVSFRRQIDGHRDEGDIDGLHAATRHDFFAPARYVLGHILDHVPHGLHIEWQSDLPIGSGLGSGAAAMAAMARAVAEIESIALAPREIAHLAWQGDIIAHGGVASGLDSGACALGGLTRYSPEEGPLLLSDVEPLTIVVGDTGIQADTAEVNTRVRLRLEAHPAHHHLFPQIGLLVREALAALEARDRARIGRLMSLNQLVLEKLGVSTPEIETLVEAALTAGALGAKLSGSGGGGIIVALAAPEKERDIAEGIARAGGTSFVTTLGVPGVRLEDETAWSPATDSVKAAGRDVSLDAEPMNIAMLKTSR